MKRIAVLLLGVSVTVIVFSCGGGDGEPMAPEPPTNRAPVAVGSIPAQEVPATDTATVDVSAFFRDPDNDRLVYSTTTSEPSVATASVAGSVVSIVAVTKGPATISVTAQDPGGLTAMQSFDVSVVGKPGPLEVVFQSAEAEVGAIVLRIEGPSVDSLQAGPGLVVYHVPLPAGVHAFVSNLSPGTGLGQGGPVLRFWSEDVSELQNYVANVEQAAAVTYEQLSAESITATVVPASRPAADRVESSPTVVRQ